MAALAQPNQVSTTRSTTLLREVIRADPNWRKDHDISVEYEFSNGREFKARSDKRGAYGNE